LLHILNKDANSKGLGQDTKGLDSIRAGDRNCGESFMLSHDEKAKSYPDSYHGNVEFGKTFYIKGKIGGAQEDKQSGEYITESPKKCTHSCQSFVFGLP
jgi:hypothetical protein